jgi:membrane protein DedA with SNARE-associated domain
LLDALLLTLNDQPLLLAIVLFGATFVVEDVATIAAGLFVARTGTDPFAAVSGVILGTAVGDLALYALGRWGAGTHFGKKLRARRDVIRAERWIAGRVLALVFAARFMPGFRLPVFTASGLVGAPFAPVAAIIAMTTPMWTGSLFAAARFAGEAGATQFVTTIIPLGLLLGLGALLLRRKRTLALAL